MKNLHPLNLKTAVVLSVTLGAILTSIMSLGNIYNERHGLHSEFHPWLNLFLNIILFFILFSYNFYTIQKYSSKIQKYCFTIVGTLLLAGAFTLIAKFLRLIMYHSILLERLSGINVLADAIIAVTVLLITFFLYSISVRQQILLENQQLITENMRIRYNNIVARLDPHFLFNSLNTLNGLVGTDDEKAHLYIHQLSSTYRYIIKKQKISTLREEMDFTHSFIYLMQIRYGKNLIIKENIDEQYSDYCVVSISLQLLIENALKHNVISDRYPLEISVFTTDAPSVVVSNKIHKKMEDVEGAGVGLANLSERYKLLCHRDISIDEADGTFTVEIPLLKADDLNLKLDDEKGVDN